MTGVSYRDILQSLVLTSRTVETGEIFQGDDARPHSARVVNEFKQQHQVNPMMWPAYSSGLNPVEYLWNVLDRRLRANLHQAVDLDQLYHFLQQEW